MWLNQDMQWYAPASNKRGRQQTFSDAAIQFCLSIKCLFGLALRQSLGLVQSMLGLAGQGRRVPDFSTVSRRQRHLQVQLPYQPRTRALELLVDSTGIKFLGEGEWKRKKHGAEYRRQWRMVHLGDRRADAGDPGHRGDRQQRRRCADAARTVGADCGR